MQTEVCCCENVTDYPSHGVFPSPLSRVWNCQSYMLFLLCASAVMCVEAGSQLAGVGSLFLRSGFHLWQQPKLRAEPSLFETVLSSQD